MPKIKKIHARQILDSRGNPTIEVDCLLSNGVFGRAAVPSGASTGEKEALELRDGDKSKYSGKGVLKAVSNVNVQCAKKVQGKEADFRKIDELLIKADGTENKGKFGANAILGVSMAVARAAANSAKKPFYKYIGGSKARIIPVPMMNIINGGAHADNSVDIQEFMIMPIGAPTFAEALRYGAETFHSLKSILKKMKMVTSVGDEGGFAPNLKSNEEALSVIMQAIKKAGYTPGKDIALAIDAAASSFAEKDYYNLTGEGVKKTTNQLIKMYERLVAKYPIISVEDGLSEHDWSGWEKLNASLGKKIQIMGDDLFVTNSKILLEGIRRKAANSILIKVNQIGSLSETLDCIDLAKKNQYTSIISHRSGETEDATIAHIAVATSVGQIKTGSASRTDRICKYNELLRIEEELGKSAVYAGKFVKAGKANSLSGVLNK